MTTVSAPRSTVTTNNFAPAWARNTDRFMTKTTSQTVLPRAVLDKNLEVKWDRVADMAQMDSGERIVLRLRLLGLERDAALATCYTDDDRKILQAAWKRFDRHKRFVQRSIDVRKGRTCPAAH